MKISTLNFYDIPISLRNKKSDFLDVKNFFLDHELDFLFIQEMNFLKPKNNESNFNIHFNPGLISKSGGLCTLSKTGLDINFKAFNEQRIKSSFMTIGDSILKKGFQYFKYESINFINTHLASTYKNSNDENLLITSQLLELEEFIKSLDGPIVVCGDFNIPPTHSSMQSFIKSLSLKDFSDNINVTLSTENSNRKSFIHNKLHHLKDIRVDYILGRDVNIHSCELAFNQPINGKHLSDHFGLIAELK